MSKNYQNEHCHDCNDGTRGAHVQAALDVISLRGVSATGYHGVLEDERQQGQIFLVDADIFVDLDRAGETDNLAHTVNYAEMAQIIEHVITGESVNLIEKLAEVIAQRVLQLSQVQAIKLTVHKPSAPIPVPFSDVAVTIFRTSKGSNRHERLSFGAGDSRAAVIALGSNLSSDYGSPSEIVARVIVELADLPQTRLVQSSAISETVAVGDSGIDPSRPKFANAVAIIETGMNPFELLHQLQQLEHKYHRVRAEHWGDRTLDLDIVDIKNVRIDSDELRIPHPLAYERDFVLQPWAEIDPVAELNGTPIKTLLKKLSQRTIDPTSDATENHQHQQEAS